MTLIGRVPTNRVPTNQQVKSKEERNTQNDLKESRRDKSLDMKQEKQQRYKCKRMI